MTLTVGVKKGRISGRTSPSGSQGVIMTKVSPSGKSPVPAVASRCERRREEILARAIELFARDGYADLDLQILADDVGVGKGTLYRYFGSKQELFLAAADRVMW